jgi:predicted transglutaminase-like cysteine proteinase
MLLALALMLSQTPGTVASVRSTYPAIFGTREVFSADSHLFTHWIDMLNRHFAEEARGDASCNAAASRAVCAIREWLEFIESERGRDPMVQLEEVNAHLNLHRYVRDIVNYGEENYWATPRQFAVNDGDCKDFAIAKYFTLRKLGWSDADLRIVVLQDLDLNEAHAITVAYVGSRSFILDNLIPQVVPSEVIRHYRPLYSINESGWWLHIARQ